MHPVERLRSVTRWPADEPALAIEAAEALAPLAGDPAGLVVACRRLLAHHPTSGPLWWLAARVLCAADPAAACRDAARALDGDRTAERLGAALPILDAGDAVAVVGWPRVVADALASRADLVAVAVAPPAGARLPRPGGEAARVRVVDGPDGIAGLPVRVAHVVAAASALGGGRALVPAATAAVLDAMPARVPVWLAAGTGRVLPRRLFDAVAAAAARDPGDDPPAGAVALERFDRVAGPRGLERPADADARPDCPVAPELLRPR